MFQPVVNLLGNSSSAWTIDHLKKVLTIPLDQLNVLNNIPGWSCKEKEVSDKVASKTDKDSTKQLFHKSQNSGCKNISGLPSTTLNNSISLQEKESLIVKGNKQSSLTSCLSISDNFSITNKAAPKINEDSHKENFLRRQISGSKTISNVSTAKQFSLSSLPVSNNFPTSISKISTSLNRSILPRNRKRFSKDCYKQTILSRSLSLSNLNKIRKFSLRGTLKRSTSTPNMNSELLSVINSFPSSHKKNVKEDILIDEPLFPTTQNIGRSVNLSDRHTYITQFTNSAVQCQMSQNSQQNSELLVSEKSVNSSSVLACPAKKKHVLETHTIPDNNHENNLIHDMSKVSKRDALKSSTSNVDKVYPKASLVINEQIGNVNSDLEEKSKDVDESFVSQLIPCAQPLPSANLPVQNKVVIAQKDIPPAFSHNEVDQTSLEINSYHPVVKRKRKIKQEKAPKKFRSTNTESEIIYSSDQVEKMLTIMKMLNGL